MKPSVALSGARGLLLLALATAPAFAQQADARNGKSLALPPGRAPLVADAAMRGDAAAVRALISRQTDVNVPQGDGMTALHWAADHGDSAMAAMLIKAHANVKVTTRIGGYTPLHIAAKS